MRTRTSWVKMVSLAVAATALFACGKGNNDAVPLSSDGNHPANWVALHGAAAASSTASCTECHGAELTGGITRIGCFSTPQTSVNGFVCHAVSPAVNPGCSSCHNTPPDAALPAGNMVPIRQFAHAAHLALANVTCNYCHFGAGFGTVNHARASAGGGIAGATVAFLNVSTLAAKTVRPASPSYDAATGSCSGIICHGGQPTPGFRTGSINVATDCLGCHAQGTAAQTPQYNSFFSGSTGIFGTRTNLHQFHLLLNVPNTANPVFCTDCHNIAVLAAKHFAGLTTPAFEGTAASSIGGGTTRITSYVPFTSAVPSGSCTSACHAINGNNPRNWINP